MPSLLEFIVIVMARYGWCCICSALRYLGTTIYTILQGYFGRNANCPFTAKVLGKFSMAVPCRYLGLALVLIFLVTLVVLYSHMLNLDATEWTSGY